MFFSQPSGVLVKKTCEYIVQEYDLELVGHALKLL
jgi:hypothetical protein